MYRVWHCRLHAMATICVVLNLYTDVCGRLHREYSRRHQGFAAFTAYQEQHHQLSVHYASFSICSFAIQWQNSWRRHQESHHGNVYHLHHYLHNRIISFDLTGLDKVTAMGSAATAMGNIGPGLNLTGPASNYFGVSVSAKWILSALMLIGRLELFTVYMLFAKSFGRGNPTRLPLLA